MSTEYGVAILVSHEFDNRVTMSRGRVYLGPALRHLSYMAGLKSKVYGFSFGITGLEPTYLMARLRKKQHRREILTVCEVEIKLKIRTDGYSDVRGTRSHS